MRGGFWNEILIYQEVETPYKAQQMLPYCQKQHAGKICFGPHAVHGLLVCYVYNTKVEQRLILLVAN